MGAGSDGGSAGRGRWEPLRGEVVRVEVIPWGEVMGADPRRVAVIGAETRGGGRGGVEPPGVCGRGRVEPPGIRGRGGVETLGGAAVTEWRPPEGGRGGHPRGRRQVCRPRGAAVTAESPPAPARAVARGTTAAATPA